MQAAGADVNAKDQSGYTPLRNPKSTVSNSFRRFIVEVGPLAASAVIFFLNRLNKLAKSQ